MPSRRSFLRQAGILSAGLFIPDNYASMYHKTGEGRKYYRIIKIQGFVSCGGSGVANVIISDGLSVTKTASDGSYRLLSNSEQKFVFISLPSGYAIPQNPAGTARFYQPIIPDREGQMTADFVINQTRNDDKYSFIVLADIHAHNLDIFHRETVPDITEFIKQSEEVPAFGVANGDMMSDHPEYFPNYEKGIKNAGIPFFQVVGNHDLDMAALTDEFSTETFCRHFGPSYYSFNKGRIHYIVLDDVFWFGEYIGYLDQKQLNWLEEDLSYTEKGGMVVVFMHIPIFCRRHIRAKEKKPSGIFNVTNRNLLYELLKPYKSVIICGHTHENEFLTDGGCEIHISGAVCGAWWTDSICYDGTPKGYLVYNIRDENLTWKYKSIGNAIDYQMRIYEARNSTGENEIIANIWGADEKWKIFWYEEGIRMGEMERRTGTDPLSTELYSGDKLPAGKTWIEPSPTDHLFYAKPAGDSGKILIEGIDRWKRVYSGEFLRKKSN